MADGTGIEWTDATWNPVTGCTLWSEGCRHCYAKFQAWPRLAASPQTVYFGRPFENVAVHDVRLDQPLRWTRPRRIFVNSLSDLFHQDVPFEFIDKVFAVMAMTPHHTYQILTKRAKRMHQYLTARRGEGNTQDTTAECVGTIYARPGHFMLNLIGPVPRAKLLDGRTLPAWPLPNVWLGVSIEDQDAADERIGFLLQSPAAIHWISAEPLLRPLDIRPFLAHDYSEWQPTGEPCAVCGVYTNGMHHPYAVGLDWVVVGGESGTKARPMHPEWARSLRDQCTAADVPFLFKQWGEWSPISQIADSDGYYDPKYGSVKRDEYDERPPKKAVASTVLQLDGRQEFAFPVGAMTCFKIGKRTSGRLLDDRTWDEYPTAPETESVLVDGAPEAIRPAAEETSA